jgi:hypothetical protein
MRRAVLSLAVLCALVGAALGVMWIRSYSHADRLHGCAWGDESFIVASKEGAVAFVWFTTHAPGWPGSDLVSFPVDDELAFPGGQYQSHLGFGYLNRPIYHVMRGEQNGWQVMGAAIASLKGGGPVVPYWLLTAIPLVISVVLFLRPWRRFSVRTLLCVMTALAAALVLSSWASR